MKDRANAKRLALEAVKTATNGIIRAAGGACINAIIGSLGYMANDIAAIEADLKVLQDALEVLEEIRDKA